MQPVTWPTQPPTLPGAAEQGDGADPQLLEVGANFKNSPTTF